MRSCICESNFDSTTEKTLRLFFKSNPLEIEISKSGAITMKKTEKLVTNYS